MTNLQTLLGLKNRADYVPLPLAEHRHLGAKTGPILLNCSIAGSASGASLRGFKAALEGDTKISPLRRGNRHQDTWMRFFAKRNFEQGHIPGPTRHEWNHCLESVPRFDQRLLVFRQMLQLRSQPGMRQSQSELKRRRANVALCQLLPDLQTLPVLFEGGAAFAGLK